MNEFLAIFSDVMRIATFQWQGGIVREGHHDRRDLRSRHRSSTGSHPIRGSRP